MSSEGTKPPKAVPSGVIPSFAKGQGGIPLFTPSHWPIGLLFLKNCWNRLRHVQAVKDGVLGEEVVAEETLPVAQFQRVMIRLLKFLNYDPTKLDFRKYVIDGTNKVDWRSFADCWKDLKIETTWSPVERVFLAFDPSGAAGSKLSQVTSTIVFFAIIASSVSFILSTLQGDLWQIQECPGCKPKPRPVFSLIEDICAVIFTTEFAIRLLTCMAVRQELLSEEMLVERICSDEPVQWLNPVGRLQNFCLETSNIIDFLAIFPYYFEKLVDAQTNLMVLRLVRLTRMFRILRLGKLSDAMDILVDTFYQSLPSLYVLSFYICLGILVCSSIVYYCEAGEWDTELQAYVVTLPVTGDKVETAFVSIPDTFWWTIVTVTTVGYGDLYPNTALGKFFGSITIVAGVIAFAMPVGVISSNFSHVWDKAQGEKSKGSIAGLSLSSAEAKTIEDGFEHAGLKRSELKFQVFHIEPPSEPLFIGVAVLDVARIPWNVKEKSGASVTLQLEGDPAKSRNRVTGFLNVNLIWEPGDPKVSTKSPKELSDQVKTFGQENGMPEVKGAQKMTSARSFYEVVKDFWSRPPTPNLQGALIVEIVSARGLAMPNARVELEVYPGLRPGVPPQQWQTSPGHDTADPNFHEIRSFSLDWGMNAPRLSVAQGPAASPTMKGMRRSLMAETGTMGAAESPCEEQENLTPLGALLPPGNAQNIADRIIEELEKEVRFLHHEKELKDTLNGTGSKTLG
eukprot:gnl/MRDRNA2_/MRDRNA2_164586_c0_seq1.p1 gnl/MRDRNA2_/MRDRNA2_164586_c0~~gnl/MRDRNA2_/MRDRNA2_164586_c0_seq1.p1  ORF type:complete len:737 (-),score=131.68 gnl/MRDRNA2_/MRDRNA2_164586_c0_seq1:18-2228(-)